MKNNRNIRIKDIAEMAGVSVGTVDRVIHNRGNVSENVEKRVKEILRESGYTPNPIGRSLGTKKDYHIAVIVPHPEQDEYWELTDKGIGEAQKKWKPYHLYIDLHRFDLYDLQSFRQASKQVLQAEPDAVLAAPIFYDESITFFQKLSAQNIPYILFNTQAERHDLLCFVGQDLYQSGRLAAELMHMTLQKPGNLAVMHIHENMGTSIHLKNKEKGFRDYFTENEAAFNICSHSFLEGNGPFEAQISNYIADNNLNGIFVTTSSGASMTAKVLIDHQKESISLIGYDLLKQNIHYLKSGVINFLINQDPRQQSFKSLHYLADYLLFNITPPSTDLLPIEIITRENYKSFLNNADSNFK